MSKVTSGIFRREGRFHGVQTFLTTKNLENDEISAFVCLFLQKFPPSVRCSTIHNVYFNKIIDRQVGFKILHKIFFFAKIPLSSSSSNDCLATLLKVARIQTDHKVRRVKTFSSFKSRNLIYGIILRGEYIIFSHRVNLQGYN